MAVKQILGKVTVTPKGEYSSDETYKRLDIVTSNGQSYIAKVDNTGVSVTDTNTWLQLVEKPEKGIDYFTEEDIAQLVSMVTDDSESEFNEYYNGKVSDFNSNASSKTSEFNSNYDEKVESFNTIFDTSTDNFDGNYETKLSAFNENASTQTSTFNSVVEQATSDFNSNTSTLTETFNTNASEKTSAFNINASEKTQEFNDNVDEKTEQITSQLDNYVQFDNYPSNEKAGVINGNINGFQVSSSGNPYAKEYTAEEYDNVGNQDFIGKGTLENAKDKIVESSTPVKNLNNSLKYLTPKQDAEGTDNTFDDGLKSPLYALAGDGNSEQVVTSGKQLFDCELELGTISSTGVPTQSNTSLRSKNFQNVTANTQYTISCNSTNSIALRFYQEDETFISSGTTQQSPSTFTTPENCTKFKFVIVNDNNLSLETMLNLGSSALPYEPYSNGIASPSPDYPQEINSIEGSVEFACRRKNLLPITIENQTKSGVELTKNDDGSITLNGTATKGIRFDLSSNIKLKEGTYTNSSNSIKSKMYVSLDNLSDTMLNGTNLNKTKTFTISKETTYNNYFIYLESGVTFNKETFKFMIEQGSQATSYEPYIEPNEVTFNLNDEKLRSVGDVKDELVVDLDTGDYFKVENIGEIIFDGSDDEGWYETGNTKVNRFGIVLNRISGAGVMSNKWIMSNIDVINLNYILDYADNTSIYVNFSDISENDDLATFKSWLSVNKPIVDYLLQNPTTKKLGTLSTEDLAKLKTFKGYNNVTVNTNLGLMNIRFTYGLDIKKYVDNKIAELSAQMIKGE